MARAKGTTTRAGKTSTQSVSKVVADNIERPHSGGSVRKVGPATQLEAEALSGQNGRRAGSVRQIGPGTIRPNQNGPGSVKYVGTKNFEDVFATRGLDNPYARQSGSVKQVGPVDRGFARLGEGSGNAGTFKTGRLPGTVKPLITSTTLLKSGAGRSHSFAVFAGQPGSFKGRQAIRIAGGGGESVLINGRKRSRQQGVEGGDTQVTPTGGSIVHG